MLAIAALLWFVYFVPTWMRRREYLATERTATRLQQTMRVMAETSEIPTEVRVAATAREVARQERILRAEQRRADASALRQAVERSAVVRAAAREPVGASVPLSGDLLRRRRMRRTRSIAALSLVAATLVTLVQIWLILTTGIGMGAWLVLAGSVVVGTTAIAIQRRLAAIAAPIAATSVSARSRTAVQVPVMSARPAPTSWTPVATPKPLYLSSPAPEHAVVHRDLRQALRDAAADAERNLRAAQAAPEVVPFRAAKPSPYSGMGVLGPDAVEATDLDEVLRRRRSAG